MSVVNSKQVASCTIGGFEFCACYVDPETGKQYPRYFEIKMSESSIVYLKDETHVELKKSKQPCGFTPKGAKDCDTVCFMGTTVRPSRKFAHDQHNKEFEVAVDDLPDGVTADLLYSVLAECCPKCVEDGAMSAVEAEQIEKA